MTSQIKRCFACQDVKLVGEFNRNPTNRDRRQSTCRSCEAEAAPRRRHGLSRLEKAQIAEAQGGCLMCGTTNPGTRGWSVDHDHRCCGPVKSCDKCRRGILCNRCNTALGMAKDDPQLLRRMADYLESGRRLTLSPSPDSEADSASDLRSGLLDNERTDGLTKKVLRNRQILQLGQRARAHTAISDSGAAS